MEQLVLVGLLLAAAALLAWRDPRRLSIGILLLTAVVIAAMDALTAVLDRYSTSIDHRTDGYILLGVLLAGLLTTLLLAAYLIVNGLMMVRREGRRLPHLLSLILGLSMLVYIAIAFVAVFMQWGAVALALVLVGLPAMYLTFVFTAFVLYGWLYGVMVKRLATPVNAVVVLGAGLREDRVTPLLASRLQRGADVYRHSRLRGHEAVIVPSGGQGPDEVVSESTAMAQWLQAAGVPVNAIVEEDKSRTTDENIAFSLTLLREQNVQAPYLVVTNNFHAFRAALMMRRHGMPGQATGSPTARYFVPSATIREFLAVLRDYRWVSLVMVGGLSLPLLGWIVALLFVR